METTRKNKRSILLRGSIILVCVLFSFMVSAQFSVGGGVSTIHEFGYKKPMFGLNAVVELPRSNDITFTARVMYGFPQEKSTILSGSGLNASAKDPNTVPESIAVPLTSFRSSDYFAVDIGQRYYALNGFDEGFSLYGGTIFGFSFSSVKWGQKPQPYDSNNYTIDASTLKEWDNRNQGSVLRLQLVLNGGMKYTLPNFGSFFFDGGMALTLLPLASIENMPVEAAQKVLFIFNLGFRKELY